MKDLPADSESEIDMGELNLEIVQTVLVLFDALEGLEYERADIINIFLAYISELKLSLNNVAALLLMLPADFAGDLHEEVASQNRARQSQG